MEINDLHERAFVRSLRARNLSARTIDTYTEALTALRRHLPGEDVAEVTGPDLEGFFADQAATRSAATAALRFRALQQFYKWAHHEDVRPDNPMLKLSPPMVPEKPVTVLTVDQIRHLLDGCNGKTFEERRDNAILRLFLEPGGPRLSELTGLTVAAVDLDEDAVSVLGKGRRARVVPFGSKTGQALDRYVRLRARHPLSAAPDLWLGKKGPLTANGIRQMVGRRAALVGLPHLHPHMLRHTAAHEWLASGGSETDAMSLFGWKSRQMLQRYGSSVAAERARDAARKSGLGDRY